MAAIKYPFFICRVSSRKKNFIKQGRWSLSFLFGGESHSLGIEL